MRLWVTTTDGKYAHVTVDDTKKQYLMKIGLLADYPEHAEQIEREWDTLSAQREHLQVLLWEEPQEVWEEYARKLESGCAPEEDDSFKERYNNHYTPYVKITVYDKE